MGRDFTPAEEHFGGPTVVLISDGYWRRHFHTDPHAIGKMLRLEGYRYTVIGVMPPSFTFPTASADVWTVSWPDAPYAQDRASTWYTALGRLKPGVSIAGGRADLARLQSELAREFPKTDKDLQVEVQPLKAVIVKDAGRSLWLLFGAVSLLLLLACSNVAALLLARTTDRTRENRHPLFTGSLAAVRRSATFDGVAAAGACRIPARFSGGGLGYGAPPSLRNGVAQARRDRA